MKLTLQRARMVYRIGLVLCVGALRRSRQHRQANNGLCAPTAGSDTVAPLPQQTHRHQPLRQMQHAFGTLRQRYRTLFGYLQYLLVSTTANIVTDRQPEHATGPLPRQFRTITNLNRIPARNYEPEICESCGHIFDPAVTADIELVTGVCQACWGNSYRMEDNAGI